MVHAMTTCMDHKDVNIIMDDVKAVFCATGVEMFTDAFMRGKEAVTIGAVLDTSMVALTPYRPDDIVMMRGILHVCLHALRRDRANARSCQHA